MSIIDLQLRDSSVTKRGPDEGPEQGEMQGFRALKFWRRMVGITVFGGALGLLLADYLSPRLGDAATWVWLLSVFLVVNSFMASRCPRCGELCFRNNLSRNTFARRCMHCRTRLYWSGKEVPK